MDEPTSALTSVETEIFSDKVKQLKETELLSYLSPIGLREVFAIGDDLYTAGRTSCGFGPHLGSNNG